MNSEELELSLRTEFENYLKDVQAAMQQDVAELQKNFEAEFEKHKAQMDEAFRNLSTRFESDIKFDQAFTESVVEHLRLARDDGAKLTAHAFSEAQKLDESSSSAGGQQLRDAINDITGQTTQASILQSLVDHASRFSPRGAFFIVKHENFVCWRRFDSGVMTDSEHLREIHFPVDTDTLLTDAVNSMATKDDEGTAHSEDLGYLDALGFGRPDRMVAVPLVARGRGVAVMYVDGGAENSQINVEAIESLVRVAGLTVELRASAHVPSQPSVVTEAPVVTEEAAVSPEPVAEPEQAPEPVAEYSTDFAYDPTPNVYAEPASYEFEEYSGAVSVEEPEVEGVEVAAEESATEYYEPVAVAEETPVETVSEYSEPHVDEPAYTEPVNDFAFASSDSYDASAPVAEEVTEPEPAAEYAYSGDTNGTNGHSYEPAPEPVVEVSSSQPVKSRLSDRHVDLPIEVSEDERRLHNDARRFARLLVSEIKLYNEQKVHEGRDASDLYDRLREAIDRSREMYEKRVQPQVAAKFDYFHYELVSNLAEGNDAKLGASYPGASV